MFTSVPDATIAAAERRRALLADAANYRLARLARLARRRRRVEADHARTGQQVERLPRPA
jgi:hypothetical protein